MSLNAWLWKSAKSVKKPNFQAYSSSNWNESADWEVEVALSHWTRIF